MTTFAELRQGNARPIYMLTISTRNLILNSSAEMGIGGEGNPPYWQLGVAFPGPGAWVLKSDGGYHGDYYFQNTPSATSDLTLDNMTFSGSGPHPDFCPVNDGTIYVLSFYYRVNIDPQTYALQAYVTYYDANLSQLGQRALGQISHNTSWTRFSSADPNPPPTGAVWAVIGLTQPSTALALVTDVDALQFEPQVSGNLASPYLGSRMELKLCTHSLDGWDQRVASIGAGRRTFVEQEGRYEHSRCSPVLPDHDHKLSDVLYNLHLDGDSLHGKDVQAEITFGELGEAGKVPLYRGVITTLDRANRSLKLQVDEVTHSLLSGSLPRKTTLDGQYVPIAYGIKSNYGWQKVRVVPIRAKCNLTQAVSSVTTTWNVDTTEQFPDPSQIANALGVTISCNGEVCYYTGKTDTSLTVVRKDPVTNQAINSDKPGAPAAHSAGDDIELVGAYLVGDPVQFDTGASWYQRVWHKDEDEENATFGQWVNVPSTLSIDAPYTAESPQYSILLLNDAPVKKEYNPGTPADGYTRSYPEVYVDLTVNNYQNACDILDDLLTNAAYGAGISREHCPPGWFNALDTPSETSTHNYLNDRPFLRLIREPQQITELVESVCLSIMGRFFFDASGHARLSVVRPRIDPITEEITEQRHADGEIEVTDDFTEVVPKVIVRCAKNWTDDTFASEAEAEKADTSYYPRIQARQPFVIESEWLEDPSRVNAQWLADKWMIRLGAPNRLFRFTGTLWAAGRELFDLVKLTAPDKDISNEAAAFLEFDLTRIDDSQIGLLMVSLESLIGGHYGFWTDDSAPNYGAASQAQKDASGYWSDDQGYSDPTDAQSLNWSRWF